MTFKTVLQIRVGFRTRLIIEPVANYNDSLQPTSPSIGIVVSPSSLIYSLFISLTEYFFYAEAGYKFTARYSSLSSSFSFTSAFIILVACYNTCS